MPVFVVVAILAASPTIAFCAIVVERTTMPRQAERADISAGMP